MTPRCGGGPTPETRNPSRSTSRPGKASNWSRIWPANAMCWQRIFAPAKWKSGAWVPRLSSPSIQVWSIGILSGQTGSILAAVCKAGQRSCCDRFLSGRNCFVTQSSWKIQRQSEGLGRGRQRRAQIASKLAERTLSASPRNFIRRSAI